MKKQQIKAFTLVELIIVITILAILATIGFMSFQSYTNDARDGKRKSDLGELRTGLEVYQAKNAILPNPNNYVTMSGISYQGYAGTNVLSKLKSGDGFQDPTDKQYYTYSINLTKDKYQLLAMLENNPNATSYNKNIINETYALDYTNRYNYSLGQNVGIYLSGTTKLPVQEGNSGTTINSTGGLTFIASSSSNSGGVSPVNGACGSSNGQTLSRAPTGTGACSATSTLSGSVTTTSTGYTWTCNGSNGGTNASCSAIKTVYTYIWAEVKAPIGGSLSNGIRQSTHAWPGSMSSNPPGSGGSILIDDCNEQNLGKQYGIGAGMCSSFDGTNCHDDIFNMDTNNPVVKYNGNYLLSSGSKGVYYRYTCTRL